MENRIPVLCDECRAQGVAGEAPFEGLGDLLDFTPVPRKKERVDGWNADRQRAFVAALAVTGSKRRAAAAVGKAQFGVDQLLKSEGSESFAAACDAAMAIAREKGSRRLADGISAVAGEAAAWAPAAGPWSRARSRHPAHAQRGRGMPPLSEEEWSDEAKEEWLGGLVRRYLLKLGAEREARLGGRIAEADFYVRQLTHIEVMLDLVSGDGFDVLNRFRVDGLDLAEIAETPMSQLLGAARRAKWVQLGEPPRPAPPPHDLLVDHGRYQTEPTESTRGGQELSHEEQLAAFTEKHARDAAAQIEWEAEARRDYERRRDSDADS